VIDSGAFTAGIVRRKGGAWLAGASRGQSVIGGLLSLGAYAIALYATTRGAVGVVAALRESSVIFAALIGALWFREPLGAARVAAAVTVAAGLLLLQAL
jgi:drug/metabolite transporter (DMT)-like permease